MCQSRNFLDGPTAKIVLLYASQAAILTAKIQQRICIVLPLGPDYLSDENRMVAGLYGLFDTALHGRHYSIEQRDPGGTPMPRDPLEPVEFPLGETDGKFLLFMAENIHSEEAVAAKVSQNTGPIVDANEY